MFCFNVLAGVFRRLLGRCGKNRNRRKHSKRDIVSVIFLANTNESYRGTYRANISFESILQKNSNYLNQLGELNNIIPSNF